MASFEHLKILEKGVLVWNSWRTRNPKINPDLSGAELTWKDLSNADFSHTSFHDANLERSRLSLANFSWANLEKADLHGVSVREADFKNANLRSAILTSAKFIGVDFKGADLMSAFLSETVFADTTLKNVKGLQACYHLGHSTLDHRTFLKSFPLPLSFLQGCGLPDTFIDYLPSLLQQSPFQFFSCFISHSSKDEEFVNRLFNDLQGKGVRCWYAPEDIKGGEKLYDQIDSAIRLHDKLLLVLSEESLKSEWVVTEIRRCRKTEKREGKRKLFPIRLVDMETIQSWECFDADSGKDLAAEVREFFIPDFSKWKEYDSYIQAFDRLLLDLRECVE